MVVRREGSLLFSFMWKGRCQRGSAEASSITSSLVICEDSIANKVSATLFDHDIHSVVDCSSKGADSNVQRHA